MLSTELPSKLGKIGRYERYTIIGTRDLTDLPSPLYWEQVEYSTQCMNLAHACQRRHALDEQARFDITWLLGNAYRAGYLAGRIKGHNPHD